MKKRVAVGVILLFLGSTGLVWAEQINPVYKKPGTLQGHKKNPGKSNIEVKNFPMLGTVPGAVTGKTTHRPVIITKTTGKASPVLHNGPGTGEKMGLAGFQHAAKEKESFTYGSLKTGNVIQGKKGIGKAAWTGDGNGTGKNPHQPFKTNKTTGSTSPALLNASWQSESIKPAVAISGKPGK